jgi:ribosomal protein L11 methyltransferase
MAWLQLVMDVPPDRTEIFEDLLLTLGACSITYRDAADQPVFEPGPGELKLWDQLQLVGLFTDDHDEADLRQALAALMQDEAPPDLTFEHLPDQVWERSWMEHFRPRRFGTRLWVCPSGFEIPADGVVLHLDPGLAFGTGTHPTTAMCLTWLDEQVLAGKTVVDYGCGSGILAIAALVLGAATALAVDNDPQALQASRDNAERNDCLDRLDVQRVATEGAILTVQADVVLANILAGPLQQLAPFILPLLRPGGALVLSGILEEQADDVMAAYSHAIDFDPPRIEEGWARLSGRACMNHGAA